MTDEDPKMDGTSSFRFTGVLGRGRVDNIVEIFDKVCGNEK